MTKTKELDYLYDLLEKSVISQYDAYIESMSDPIKDDLTTQSKFLSKDQLFENKKIELKKILNHANAESMRIKNAFETFAKYKKQFLGVSEIQKLNDEILEFSKSFLSSPPSKNPKVNEDSTVQDFLGVSDYVLYCFYTVGYNLLQTEHFGEAANIFFLLSMWNSLVKDHWMALGLAEQGGHRYEAALKAFAVASILGENDPRPHFHAVECYLELKDFKNAEAELSLAKSNIPRDDSHKWHTHLDKVETELNRKKIKITGVK